VRNWIFGDFARMQYYTYILYSEKLDKYYIGATGDLKKRLSRHNSSNKGFTSTGKPWLIVYSEVYDSRSTALKREKQLKGWKNRERLVTLILKGRT
jgi:putative endonuclease